MRSRGNERIDPAVVTTAELYAASGIGSRTGFGSRPALVVVDLQAGFTNPASGVGGELGSVVEASSTLIASSRRSGIPVMFTAVGFQPGERSNWLRKMPGLGVLVEGGHWCELDQRLDRHPNEPMWVKRAASAFYGTPLQAHLVSQAIDTVIICGCVTSGCIRATAIDAASAGFRVIVPAECVGDRSEDVHRANLFDIDSKYGDVVPLEDVLRHLSKGIRE